jgi:hypothetical protein
MTAARKLLMSAPAAAGGGLVVESSINTESVTTSITCPSMTDGLILVLVGGGSLNPESVTYNSVSLTQHGATSSPNSPIRYASIYYLVAPSTGSNDLVFSSHGNSNASVVFISGVNQTTPLDTASTLGVNAGGTLTLNPVSAVGDFVFDVIGFRQSSPGVGTPGTGQTALYNQAVVSDRAMAASYKDGSAASTAMQWTVGGTRTAYVAAAVLPV